MRNLLILILLFCLTSLGFAQQKAIYFEHGVVLLRESIRKKSNLVKPIINGNIPFSIGLKLFHEQYGLQIGYHYQNLAIGEHPVYKGFWATRVHTTNKPYYIHSLIFNYSRNLYEFSNKNCISSFVGIQLGYIPENKWEPNDLPKGDDYYGYQFLLNQDSAMLFESKYYPRLISDIFANIKLGLSFELAKAKNPYITISPFYAFGLNPFHRIDYWYYDYVRKVSDKIVVINNGSQFGVLFRVEVKIQKKENKKIENS